MAVQTLFKVNTAKSSHSTTPERFLSYTEKQREFICSTTVIPALTVRLLQFFSGVYPVYHQGKVIFELEVWALPPGPGFSAARFTAEEPQRVDVCLCL